jgi:hypothetical protein
MRTRRFETLFQIASILLATVPAPASENHSRMPSQGDCTMSAREVVGEFIDLLYDKKEVRRNRQLQRVRS